MRETPIAVGIETALAVRDIGEILSVEGIDVALVGHSDLSLSLGVPLQLDHPSRSSTVRGGIGAILEAK